LNNQKDYQFDQFLCTPKQPTNEITYEILHKIAAPSNVRLLKSSTKSRLIQYCFLFCTLNFYLDFEVLQQFVQQLRKHYNSILFQISNNSKRLKKVELFVQNKLELKTYE
jgi:hypothetical protein